MAWSLGGQAATLVFGMAGTMALARLLTPAETGAFAFAVAMFALVQSLLQFGMANYILRAAELTQARIDSATTLALLQALAAALLMAALAPAAGWFANSSQIVWLSLLVALMPVLSGPEAVSTAFWAREGHFRTIALLNTGKTLAQAVVGVVTALAGWGPYALAAGFLASGVVSLLRCAPNLMARGVRLRIDRDEWRLMKDYSIRSMLLTITVTLNLRVPDLLIGRLFTIASLGQYSRAYGAIDMLGRSVSYPIARVFTPRMLNALNDGQPPDKAVSDIRDAFLFLLWPMLAGLAVLAHPVTFLLYGPQWTLAGDILAILCLANAFDMARAGGMEVLLFRDRLGLNNKIEAARLIVSLGLLVAAVPFGFLAAMWSRAAAAAFGFLLYGWVLHRLEDIPLARYVRNYAMNGVLTLLAVAPALGVMVVRDWPSRVALGEMLGLVAAGSVLFLAGAFAFRHPAALFLAGYWRRRRARGIA